MLACLALRHLELAQSMGAPSDVLLGKAKLHEKQLHQHNGRVPLASFARLWRATSECLPDPGIGLQIGSATQVSALGLIGYAMVFSANLGAALQRLARYARVLCDELEVTLSPDGFTTWIEVRWSPELGAFRPAIDAWLAFLRAACCEVTAGAIAPVAVRVPYRQPADTRTQLFFGAPIQFNVLSPGLCLRANDLARPLPRADENLCSHLDELAEQRVTSVEEDRCIAASVRKALQSDLSRSTRPSVERTARALGLSARSLQRRLRAEGTTFITVLERLRRDLAIPLLRDGMLTVAQVAFLLGYADPGSFERAFRKWFGTCPRDARA